VEPDEEDAESRDLFAMTHEKRTLFAKLGYAWLR